MNRFNPRRADDGKWFWEPMYIGGTIAMVLLALVLAQSY